MHKTVLFSALLAFAPLGAPMARDLTPPLADAERLLRQGAYRQVEASLLKLSAVSSVDRQHALILQAEAALGMGLPRRAGQLFERAASQFNDSPEAEVGQIRAYYQEGDIQHAIAFGNIVAGEHPDSAEAFALLSWFEDRVGHTDRVLGKLREAQAKAPDDIALLGALADVLVDRGMAFEAAQILDARIGRNPPGGAVFRLRAKAALALGEKQEHRHWLARAVQAYEAEGETAQAWRIRDWLSFNQPGGKSVAVADLHALPTPSSTVETQEKSRWRPVIGESFALPKGVRFSVGNGVILDGGQRVLTHARIVAGAKGEVHVRNGLGQVRKARIERLLEKDGLALLKLSRPYPAQWGLKPDAGAVGGKFCFVLGFPVADTLDGFSPTLKPCVVVRADAGVGGLMQITAGLSADQSGSPVFDPNGQLIGLALGRDDGISGVADRQAFLGKGDFAIRAQAFQGLVKSAQRSGKAQPAPTTSQSVEALYDRLRPAVVMVAAPSVGEPGLR